MSAQTIDPLSAWISWQTGTQVSQSQVSEVLGISRFAYRNRRLSEKGLPASDVINAARAWQLNPVTALVALGYVSPKEVDGWGGEAVSQSANWQARPQN